MKATMIQTATNIRSRPRGTQNGSIVVIVMVFTLVFLVTGVALYYLVSSQTDGTELERTDLKAFNIAEAGVDAGMRALALNWPVGEPASPEDATTVDEATLKASLQAANASLWDPSRSDASEFIRVYMYDNVDTSGGEPYPTTMIADSNAPNWDYNKDGKMFVDARSNVDDDRHRILVLAERQVWPLRFPLDIAMFASSLVSGARGMVATVEDGTPPIYCAVSNDPEKKGLKLLGTVSYPNEDQKTLDDFVNNTMINTLRSIARSQGNYFEGGAAAKTATQNRLLALETKLIPGQVIFLDSTETGKIKLGSSIDILGSVDKPVVIVVNAPKATDIEWDGKTTVYGVFVALGNATLGGSPSVHGALYCSKLLTNNGGATTEIVFNQTVIQNINGGNTVSVNIVPNTWEEYTIAASTPTTAGP